jgi:hypothetical protein
VIQALYHERDAVKQTIYEVMGISDIMRGSVDPREKATQSTIKVQSGSRRLQRSQTEVARFARDLFRMKVEIMAKRFSVETLEQMSGLSIEPQVAAALQSNLRGFSIDIETDSTVRADLAKYQDELNAFLNGTAQIGQAVTAIAGVMPAMVEPLWDVYASFARKFNLGKQGEDALDRLSEAAKKLPEKPGAAQADPQALQQQAQQAEQQMAEQQAAAAREQDLHEAAMRAKMAEQEARVMEIEARRETAAIERDIKLLDLEARRMKGAATG